MIIDNNMILTKNLVLISSSKIFQRQQNCGQVYIVVFEQLHVVSYTKLHSKSWYVIM